MSRPSLLFQGLGRKGRLVKKEAQSKKSIFRDFKKHTAKEMIQVIERINESRGKWLVNAFKKAGKDLKRITKFKVWQDGNHPEQLMSNKFIDQKLDYVHNNPVEAEIVDEPGYYWHSSARDYTGK